MTGEGEMTLWCRRCYRLTSHVRLVWREKVPPRGRRLTANCSECSYRDREGYIIYEDPLVGSYAGSYEGRWDK